MLVCVCVFGLCCCMCVCGLTQKHIFIISSKCSDLPFLLLLLRLLYHILFYSMLPIPILGSTFCLFTRTHMHPHIHSLSYLPTRVNISCKCAINKNRRNKPKKMCKKYHSRNNWGEQQLYISVHAAKTCTYFTHIHTHTLTHAKHGYAIIIVFGFGLCTLYTNILLNIEQFRIGISYSATRGNRVVFIVRWLPLIMVKRDQGRERESE